MFFEKFNRERYKYSSEIQRWVDNLFYKIANKIKTEFSYEIELASFGLALDMCCNINNLEEQERTFLNYWLK